MTTPDPFQRFLGVPSSADALTLLGLREEDCTPLGIDKALQSQLIRVFQHSDSRSEQAEQVRHALRAAATELRQRIARQADADRASARQVAAVGSASTRQAVETQPAGGNGMLFNLTTFDRMVLAVLVGYGGWNPQSRARLVALASMYGITAQGLMRVVQGLSAYARAGGPRLGVNEIAVRSPYRTGSVTPVPAGGPASPPLLDRLTEGMSAELHRNDPWPTIKLSAIFAIVTLIAGIITLRMIFGGSDATESTDASKDRVAQIDASNAQQPDQRRSADLRNPLESRHVRYPRTPTFLGNAMPIEAVNAASQCAQLPTHFQQIVARLTTSNEPSEAVYRNWEVSTQTIATGWALTDLSTRDQINREIFLTLRACADRPTVTDRMLKSLSPPPAVAEPLELWRGAWKTGTLARVAASKDLPPVVVERARGLLDVALGAARSGTGSLGFETAGRAWLQIAATQLVGSLEFDERAYDFWELWLSAHRAFGRGEAFDAALMDAIAAILKTETDLSRIGPSTNVLARLLNELLEQPSQTMREKLQALFDDQSITTRDLWALTSLISLSDRATWFSDALVLPEDASAAHRARIRDDIAAAWPAGVVNPEGSRVPVIAIDPFAGQRWFAVVDELLHEGLERTPDLLMRQLVKASRVNEAAAALVNADPVGAQQILDALGDEELTPASAKRAAVTAPRTSSLPPVYKPRQTSRVGQSLGRDGEWAAAYLAVSRNTQERLNLLESLQRDAGTDLGPVDAELLVREAYRASPQEVRAMAQFLIVDVFHLGPNVVMQLLEQFADAPHNQAVSEMLQNVTGQLLPAVRSADWERQARLTLVLHMLSLAPENQNKIDLLTEPLIEAYVSRLTALAGDSEPSVAPSSPQAAAALLAQAWLDKATLFSARDPVPDTPAGLRRRNATRLRLADGPIQTMVAHQLAILDAITYITVAEQPELRDAAIEQLRESAAIRDRLENVLEQAVEVERAIARLWRLRLTHPLEKAQSNAAKEIRS